MGMQGLGLFGVWAMWGSVRSCAGLRGLCDASGIWLALIGS